MDYDSALNYIYSAQRFASSPELTRITELLSRTGNPQDSLKFVHIGGTNGKGSTAALMTSVLIEAGYKTGTFISPYLERFNERIQVNNKPVPDEAVAELAQTVKHHINAMLKDGHRHPSVFEIITAMAFLYWKQCGCDILVLEVGMGGRLDATNVIQAPLLAMIQSISFDHMAKLGNTLGDIAFKKCGIIKPGTGAAVSYAKQNAQAQLVIERQCALKGVRLIVPDTQRLQILAGTVSGSDFMYKGIQYHVPLMGEHQVYNALGVIEAAEALNGLGFKIPAQAVARGVQNVRWPGRLEIIHNDPLCIIDAAHNFGAVLALCDAVDTYLQERPIVAVMGMLKDKEYEKCIPELAKRSRAFIATKPDNPRALEAELAANIAKKHCVWVESEPGIPKAVDRAFDIAKQTGAAVLICGSLYVIGNARTYVHAQYGRVQKRG